MKTLLFATGIVALMGVAVSVGYPSTAEVKPNGDEEDVELIPELPDWAEDEEAVEAAKAVIHRKDLEDQLNRLEANFEASTTQYEADKAEYLDKKAELEKELGLY